MSEPLVETARGEEISKMNWVSWVRKGEGRQFGKAYVTPTFSKGSFENRKEPWIGDWQLEEFSWAVAEGRIPEKSVWVLDNHLARHEMIYIWGKRRFK